MEWYADAHHIADMLARKNGIPTNAASGIIAALSPLQSWGANVNLAARLIENGGLDSGYLSVGLRKANAILSGTDPLDVLLSDKVRNFYLSISAAGETDAVCVDRHAWALATNRRGDETKLSGARYAAVADAYRRAATIATREAGTPVHAAQLQAITWVSWRARYWAEGAWDKHSQG